MEMNLTVSMRDIINALVNEHYQQNTDDTFEIIKKVDEEVSEWDFTIRVWKHFDKIVQGGIIDSDYVKQQVEEYKNEQD